MQEIVTPTIAILEALSACDRATRTELADVTGLSPATVGRAVDQLRRDHVLRESALMPSGVGRPPRVVELDERATAVVAVDAGGRTLRASLSDLRGNLRARAARPVRDPADGETLLHDLVAIVEEVGATAGPGAVQAVVAGISGIVDAGTGRVLLAPDLPGLAGLDLGPELGRRLDRPVAIDNDDLLAAIGEATAGAALGCRDVVFLSLGYGLGAGLIVAGRPVRGASNAAGAIGYLAPGRLQERSSGRAIAARYERGRHPDTGPAVDARGVFLRAASADPVALAIIADALAGLGDLLVAAASLMDPEVIVLGGGLTAAGSALFGPLGQRLREGVPYPPRLAASVLGDAAVLHGATSMALVLARRRLAGVSPFPRAASSRGALALI